MNNRKLHKFFGYISPYDYTWWSEFMLVVNLLIFAYAQSLLRRNLLIDLRYRHMRIQPPVGSRAHIHIHPIVFLASELIWFATLGANEWVHISTGPTAIRTRVDSDCSAIVRNCTYTMKESGKWEKGITYTCSCSRKYRALRPAVPTRTSRISLPTPTGARCRFGEGRCTPPYCMYWSMLPWALDGHWWRRRWSRGLGPWWRWRWWRTASLLIAFLWFLFDVSR